MSLASLPPSEVTTLESKQSARPQSVGGTVVVADFKTWSMGYLELERASSLSSFLI